MVDSESAEFLAGIAPGKFVRVEGHEQFAGRWHVNNNVLFAGGSVTRRGLVLQIDGGGARWLHITVVRKGEGNPWECDHVAESTGETEEGFTKQGLQPTEIDHELIEVYPDQD